MEMLEKRSAVVSKWLSTSPVSADLSSDYPDNAWADEVIGRRARYADLTRGSTPSGMVGCEHNVVDVTLTSAIISDCAG